MTMPRWLDVNWMKVRVNHTLMQKVIATRCQIMSFVIKISCDLSKVTKHYNKSHVALKTKNNHLQLKKPIVNMQIFLMNFIGKIKKFIQINESFKQLILVKKIQQPLSKFYVEWIFFHIF
jgi:hypothetical protein